MKLNYYAILNDNNICTDVISTVRNYNGVKGYIPIPHYNESLYYKKYDPETKWSEETYEPDVDTVMQTRVGNLEIELESTKQINSELVGQVSQLDNSIMELTAIISALLTQGGN